ncbi:MAG: GNAT family N-acetyltransferase [Pseudomonadota bacterium]
MADGGGAFTARTVSAIAEIGADAWDACANSVGAPHNPFVSYAFLAALENSASARSETGWGPTHAVLEEDGDIVGVAPLYVKGHSQGEYIFDHHWADAYERAGGRYYPKLLCAAPFTPAQGPRLLAATPARRAALGAAIARIAEQYGVSSVHVNFLLEGDAEQLCALGFLERRGVQYHWFNRDYPSFDAFLDTLASRKRKAIRRERRAAAESGLALRQLQGADITEQHWNAFWIFYQDTGARKWGSPYLTRSFFREVAETMSDQLLMIVAERDGAPVAGALNFIGGDTLYGRYWGCTEHYPFLHFEVCFHQAIDFAIAEGLSRVEAGAQGEHKIARGYEPVATRSAHWIRDAGFRQAIDQYLESERAHGQAEIDVLARYTPFKKG